MLSSYRLQFQRISICGKTCARCSSTQLPQHNNETVHYFRLACPASLHYIYTNVYVHVSINNIYIAMAQHLERTSQQVQQQTISGASELISSTSPLYQGAWVTRCNPAGRSGWMRWMAGIGWSAPVVDDPSASGYGDWAI